MLERTQPEAVAAFTSTLDHPQVVEAAATRHVARDDGEAAGRERRPTAQRIRRAAESGNIHVIVNYETTWYPSHVAAVEALKEPNAAGDDPEDGRAWTATRGPKEIGVGPEFLAWLTDPVQNGGGALFDFGCYGANLMTWLMDNERPRPSPPCTSSSSRPSTRTSTTRRRSWWSTRGAGHHPGVVELAVRPEGPRGLRRARATRSHGAGRRARALPERWKSAVTPGRCRGRG